MRGGGAADVRHGRSRGAHRLRRLYPRLFLAPGIRGGRSRGAAPRGSADDPPPAVGCRPFGTHRGGERRGLRRPRWPALGAGVPRRRHERRRAARPHDSRPGAPRPRGGAARARAARRLGGDRRVARPCARGRAAPAREPRDEAGARCPAVGVRLLHRHGAHRQGGGGHEAPVRLPHHPPPRAALGRRGLGGRQRQGCAF
mmetsp:Transcript_5847/g.16956  ORF Transcript_5847/g.16956 Transcript_5847/m.16956 type:complete len:200 (-) Transcript_5847:1090-1689(-)